MRWGGRDGPPGRRVGGKGGGEEEEDKEMDEGGIK